VNRCTTVALLRHRRLQSRYQRNQAVIPASVSAPLCGGTDNTGLPMGTCLDRAVGHRPGHTACPGLSSSGSHCAIDEGSVPACGSGLVPLFGHEHRYRLCHLSHPDAFLDQLALQRQEAKGSSLGYL
jgi:hypothetical protein